MKEILVNDRSGKFIIKKLTILEFLPIWRSYKRVPPLPCSSISGRNSKVSQFHLTFHCKKHIARFQVPMYDLIKITLHAVHLVLICSNYNHYHSRTLLMSLNYQTDFTGARLGEIKNTIVSFGGNNNTFSHNLEMVVFDRTPQFRSLPCCYGGIPKLQPFDVQRISLAFHLAVFLVPA